MQSEDEADKEDELAPKPLPEDYWNVADETAEKPVKLDDLVATLHRGDPRECASAVQQFVRFGQEAVPVLRELIESDNPDVRIDAQKALDQIEGS